MDAGRVFDAFRGIVKADAIAIDGKVFKLHYRLTMVMLLLAFIMVSSRQYFGDPINCMPSVKDEIPKDVLESYCWIHSTFTLPRGHGEELGVDVAHPGIRATKKGEERKYHSYYQWVSFALIFQALFFYLPHFLWKCFEKDTMKKIILELNLPIHADCKENRKLLTQYLARTMRQHNLYAIKYFVCEVLNLVNVIVQIYLIDDFLGGEFLTYGKEVLAFTEMDQENRTDPMIYVFPRVTKCLFRKFGPSGDIQTHDSLCVLPLNVVNEKVYVLMWFWFIILSVITAVHLLTYVPVIIIPKFRFYMMRLENSYTRREDLYEVMRQASVGDWLILHFLGKNMDPINFREVVKSLASDMNGGGELHKHLKKSPDDESHA